jgi:DNA processing protein
VTWHRLLAEHGSPRAALAALPSIARAAGVADYAPCPVEVARHEMTQGRLAGAMLLVHGEPGYPAPLAALSDAPPVLWVRGDPAHLHRPMVALVGARNASSLGLRMARRLAEGLGAAGFTVVSGLARGIDAEAHRSALATGTVAVMPGGVDVVYPPENLSLAGEIARAGALLSEHAPGMEPASRHFPARNRIVAGLVRAVVVVEAAARSGTLITAREAVERGREVLAVPGHPMDPRAEGCLQLIREGAILIRGPADVIDVLGPGLASPSPPRPLPGPPPPAPRPQGDVAALHAEILLRLGPTPMAEDQLIRDLGRPASDVSPALLRMELDGAIHRHPGGLICRA